MEDDEDDLYGDEEQQGQPLKTEATRIKAENDEEEDEEDSDDDIEFTLERTDNVKAEPSTTSKPVVKISSDSATPQPAKRARTSAPVKQEAKEAQAAASSALLHNGKEGKDYPEVRTSTLDLNADPTWPGDGKKISEVDIDADLAEMSKPWRLPGTDQTDFFNYGFDEYTWVQYSARQQSMVQTIGDLKDEDAKMKAMLGGMPGDSSMPDMSAMMPFMMGGMGGGMPDPSKMDFSQMQQMMGMMGGMPGQAFSGQQGTGSPMPQGGQGFQAPSGPGGHQDGFSMMQEQQQQQQQGGGRRGRRGRGGFNY